MRAAFILALAVLVTTAFLLLAFSRNAPQHASLEPPLSKIAPAPEFALTSQDGAPVTLADYRGKVVAVTFILTMCTTTCPVLTPMMSFVQDQLGRDFGAKISFVSITVDPERDTVEVLRQYAQSFGANFAGWSFLTGTPEAIRDAAHRYGVFVSKTANGDVEHTFLTSIVDRHGILRVQYLGVRFDPEEFRRDLLSLLKE
jgi:protein SCO1